MYKEESITKKGFIYMHAYDNGETEESLVNNVDNGRQHNKKIGAEKPFRTIGLETLCAFISGIEKKMIMPDYSVTQNKGTAEDRLNEILSNLYFYTTEKMGDMIPYSIGATELNNEPKEEVLSGLNSYKDCAIDTFIEADQGRQYMSNRNYLSTLFDEAINKLESDNNLLTDLINKQLNDQHYMPIFTIPKGHEVPIVELVSIHAENTDHGINNPDQYKLHTPRPEELKVINKMFKQMDIKIWSKHNKGHYNENIYYINPDGKTDYEMGERFVSFYDREGDFHVEQPTYGEYDHRLILVI